jgi:peptidoglycan L-alanyl-D-glutamate endopeptidase CwlK
MNWFSILHWLRKRPKTSTMRDQISIDRCNKLHPKIRQEAIAAIAKAEAGFPANMKIRVVQGLRTIAEQDALYAQGRTKPGQKVTNARGGSSYHNYGLAIDFAIMHDRDGNGSYEQLSWDTALDFDQDGVIDWQEVVKAFKEAGWEWGGDFRSFPDFPHVQKTFGYTVKQLKAMGGDPYPPL